ncbi:hypothetical protein NCAS_0A09180 [Naumovozyma castellii]|uniref:Uncharacterized protein n=1 Tax=Naumovozyma castellii TaxID=27288 RepID=G0V7M8_NAUCA|nr:hypothetical protein NCAS_0A09180 [Naumovozyma castellii CBS 4309]CCC67476.1 hypothetical protein NCAS_0A09180 [Naumovozyma castellii CBS 4309]
MVGHKLSSTISRDAHSQPEYMDQTASSGITQILSQHSGKSNQSKLKRDGSKLSHIGFQPVSHQLSSRSSNPNMNVSTSYLGTSRRNSVISSSSSSLSSKTTITSNRRKNSTSSRSLTSTLSLSLPLSRKKSAHTLSIFGNHQHSQRSANISTSNTSILSVPSISTSTSKSSASRRHKFTQAVRRIFPSSKVSSHQHKVDIEPVIPTSLSNFLHSSFERHKMSSPSQFFYNPSLVSDSNHSIYSFNPSISHDPALSQEHNPAYILQDLLRHLPSLEANYKSFSAQELENLSENVWYIYCSNMVELFKDHRIWDLPMKVEDISRIFDFYRRLTNFDNVWLNVKEFLDSSLFVFENEIVFNYTNEDIMNSTLKRLCVIWEKFYQQIYYDVLTILLSMEKDENEGKLNQKVINEKERPSMEILLLQCFRDTIVLPYFQNFIHSDTGVRKTFQLYILNQEEERKITNQDKRVLLQCFGILSTINSMDMNQNVIEELLKGIRIYL